MPMSRFWRAFWTVAGFLFLIGWLQQIMDTVLTLFGLVDWVAAPVAGWIRLVAWGVVPIWGAITFFDWRWGWKPDNAGFRTTPAAAFWLVPGLLAGVAAVVIASLLTGGLNASLPMPFLSPLTLLKALLVAVAVFASEVVYRGGVISRFQQDLSGWQMLAVSLAMPLVWSFVQSVIGFVYFLPTAGVFGWGTAALSIFLSLLFLRTDSVWLSAGIRIPVALFGVEFALLTGSRPLMTEEALLVVFGIPAAVLLLLELAKFRNIRRPGGGPKRGSQRVTFGKTVRGPWGPH